jgi:hypothetical protein
MSPVSAMSGWHWAIKGWRLFVRQPAQLTTLFASNMFLLLLLGMIPILGHVLPLILTPTCTMALMSACALIERGEPVAPNVWLAAFRGPAFPSLFRLGLLYLLAGCIALWASRWADGGLLWQLVSGQMTIDPNAKTLPDVSRGMLAALLAWLPAALILWYCAPLIMWRNMRLSKAVFYSSVTVWRLGPAFVMYALAWIMFGVMLPLVVNLLVAAMLPNPGLRLLIALSISLIVSVALYCSFYPSYTEVFGQPDLPAPGL